MPGPILELIGIRKSYGSVRAVERVDLTVTRGEFVTFLGPSGSGKTTTLMMIAGLQQPTEGEIRLEGRSLRPLPPHRRGIGMVFQQYALFPHMTVAENVAFPLEMRRVGREDIRRRVERVLDLVGLPDHHERLPANLSGGQQQRVALARAIVFEPPLLLMDEPLGALDRKLRDQMQEEITRLHKELGITVVYVTHDQAEALAMSHRIAVFNAGRIEQIGSPNDVYERPQTRFVADFLGESCFLPGVVHANSPGFAVIQTSHGHLRGHNRATLAPGQLAVLTVRPERLILTDPHDGATDNRLSGTVRSHVYQGQSGKVVIALRDGTEIAAFVHPAALEQDKCCPGNTVTVGWSSTDCSILPAPPA